MKTVGNIVNMKKLFSKAKQYEDYVKRGLMTEREMARRLKTDYEMNVVNVLLGYISLKKENA